MLFAKLKGMQKIICALFFLLGLALVAQANNEPKSQVSLWLWQPSATHAPMILPRLGGETAEQPFMRYQQALRSEPGLKPVLKNLVIQQGRMQAFVLRAPSVLLIANDKDDMDKDPRRFFRFSDPIATGGVSSYLLPITSDLGLDDLQKRRFHQELIQKFQGVVALGGDDVDPALIGQKQKHSVGFNRLRDASELAILRTFLRAANKFVVGICRGHQMILSLLDARYRLVQDIEAELKLPTHRNTFHVVQEISPKLTASMFPLLNEGKVNSLHHQGFFDLPEDGPVRVTAVDENGIVEATEFKNGRGFTFQFHPELMSKAVSSEFGRILASSVLRLSQSDSRTKAALATDMTRVRCETAL